MEQIKIPFTCKALAHDLGVQFDTKTRNWYIPEGTSEELAQRMRDLEFQEENQKEELEKEENITSDMDALSSEICDNINTHFSSSKSIDWSPILEKSDTLYTAMMIRDYGMPEDKETRTAILRLLGRRHPKDYAIEYDSLCNCAPDFARLYPEEQIETLVLETVTNGTSYLEQIRESQLTEEEKALLFFVLPV